MLVVKNKMQVFFTGCCAARGHAIAVCNPPLRYGQTRSAPVATLLLQSQDQYKNLTV